MRPTTGHTANSHVRSLAEAIILQSIEDLWHPVCKKGSLMFFEGDAFTRCSEIAGISYIKQLAMLRMLANAGTKSGLRRMRKSPEGVFKKSHHRHESWMKTGVMRSGPDSRLYKN